MPRRATKPAARRRPDPGPEGLFWRVRGPWLIAAAVALAVGAWVVVPESPERLRARAEAAERAGDWSSALPLWRAVNQTRLARGRTHLAEARASLALDRAAQAEVALRQAIAADPGDAEPWRLLLQLCRVEERTWEARRLGEDAAAAVLPSTRREVLRDATLALLADLPDEQARGALDRWVASDPSDLDARVARLRRAAAHPGDADPDRADRIAALSAVLERNPGHVAARELLVESLADAGDPQRGREALDGWPTSARDGCYDRLLGRWQLDYDHDPAGAAASFQRALVDFPHDWRTHYRLARAWRAVGRDDDARREAEIVGRLREVLDPAALGPRLSADIGRLDEPASCRDLAELCARAGLTRLADAWRREADAMAHSAASEGHSQR